jgi:hypothetical protein
MGRSSILLVYGHPFYLSIQHVLKQNSEGLPQADSNAELSEKPAYALSRDIKGGRTMDLDAKCKSMPRIRGRSLHRPNPQKPIRLIFPLQFGYFTLDIFPHVAVKIDLHLAEWALEIGPFHQDFQREFVLFSTERAGNRQLFLAHLILQYLRDYSVSRAG